MAGQSLKFCPLSMKKKTTLYIVPTPIGNLEDITFRAIKILEQVDLIAAEDTRNSKNLLQHYKIKNQLISYHKFSENKRTKLLINKLKSEKNVALISDAGTPGISDPAAILIKAAIKNKIRVETLPGPTAFIPALISSGLNAENFFFGGFLPKKNSEIEKLLEKIKTLSSTLIFYETAHRILNSIAQINEVLGNRKIVIARELTKIYETYYRGKISAFLSKKIKLTLKGEFVLILEGCKQKKITDETLIQLLKNEINKGKSKKTAIKNVVAMTNVNKNRIYALALKISKL